MSNYEMLQRAKKELVECGVITLSENVYTASAWKKMGFIVREGEEPIIRIPVWVCTQRKPREDGETVRGRWWRNPATGFYKRSQVDVTKTKRKEN